MTQLTRALPMRETHAILGDIAEAAMMPHGAEAIRFRALQTELLLDLRELLQEIAVGISELRGYAEEEHRNRGIARDKLTTHFLRRSTDRPRAQT